MKLLYVLSGMIVLITVMGITSPTEATFNKWIQGNLKITCEERYCFKEDEQLILTSSHIRNAIVFSSYEQQFESSNGKKITIRTVGVFGQVFKMENNELWEMVN